MLPVVLNVFLFIAGLAIVARTLLSAIRTFIMPRAESDRLTGLVFLNSRRIFDFLTARYDTYPPRDRIMAFYAPVTLFLLPAFYLFLMQLGFFGMFLGIGVRPVYNAFLLSGSSLLTLGFAQVSNLPQMILAFAEATFGLILIAVLIAYLPTMYSAFSRREQLINMLEVRAGTPPSAVVMYARFQRLQRLDRLPRLFERWENWFVDLEESHTSLAAVVFFRSPRPDQSWVTASGAILDAAALHASTLDLPRDVQADLTIRAGYLALRSIADFFNVVYDFDPQPGDPISITRAEFDAACAELEENGLTLKPDRAQCWRDFAGWRVNYDAVLLALARLTMAPPSPWTGPRDY